MTSCPDNINCPHYLSIANLCPNHSHHANLVRTFDDDSVAFKQSAAVRNVTTVQVSTKANTICEWDGVCSLEFLHMIDNNNALVSDHMNQLFRIPSSNIVSFN